LKNRILSFALALLMFAFALSSCTSSQDNFESFWSAVKKFDIEKMSKYVDTGSLSYMDGVSSYAGLLSEEQTEIVKTLFSNIEYSYNTEPLAEAKSYDIKLSYVDVALLINTVEENMAIGTGNASKYIKEIIDSGAFEARYIKKANVKVSLSDECKIVLGYIGENGDLTRLLSIDAFLRWYSAQR
jgi:hypothetical protein